MCLKGVSFIYLFFFFLFIFLHSGLASTNTVRNQCTVRSPKYLHFPLLFIKTHFRMGKNNSCSLEKLRVKM